MRLRRGRVLLKTAPVLDYGNIRGALKAAWRVRREEEEEWRAGLHELLRQTGRLEDDECEQ